MSTPANPGQEYVLNGDGGVRAVGRRTAEVTFFLPGSAGYDDWIPAR